MAFSEEIIDNQSLRVNFTQGIKEITQKNLANNPLDLDYIVFIGRQISNNGYYMKSALKLDKVFCCRKCASVFLFESDVEDHAEMCGHRSIVEIDL